METSKVAPVADYGRWAYGEAGDRWPVRPGDVWSVGPHREPAPAEALLSMCRERAASVPAAG